MIVRAMDDLLTAFQSRLAGDGRAARTIGAYSRTASAFLRGLSARSPSRADVDDFLGRRRRDGRKRSPAGRNQELAALRALADVAVGTGRWAQNPTEGVKFAKQGRSEPVFLDEGEVGRLFRAAATSPPRGERLQLLAVVGVLTQTGLRVHELVGLDVGQVDFASRTLLKVKGKGGTVDDVRFNAPAAELLAAWMRERERRAPPSEQALFVSSRRERLSIRTVERWFESLRVPMGTLKNVSPHSVRHSYATILLFQGTDVATVSHNMRHADINSTLRYLHRIDGRGKEATDRLASVVPPDVVAAAVSASVTNDPAEHPPKDALPSMQEALSIQRTSPLDGQYRLDAKSRPPESDGQDSLSLAA